MERVLETRFGLVGVSGRSMKLRNYSVRGALSLEDHPILMRLKEYESKSTTKKHTTVTGIERMKTCFSHLFFHYSYFKN